MPNFLTTAFYTSSKNLDDKGNINIFRVTFSNIGLDYKHIHLVTTLTYQK